MDLSHPLPQPPPLRFTPATAQQTAACSLRGEQAQGLHDLELQEELQYHMYKPRVKFTGGLGLVISGWQGKEQSCFTCSLLLHWLSVTPNKTKYNTGN